MAPKIIVGVVGQSNARGTDTPVPYAGVTGTYNYKTDTWITPILDPYSPAASAGASFAVSFCDKFLTEFASSVGTVPTAIGGIGVLVPGDDNWSSDDDATYSAAAIKLRAAGPLQFLITWVGEQDMGSVTTAQFKAGYHLFVANIRRDLGLPNLIIYAVKPAWPGQGGESDIRTAYDEIVSEDANIRLCADANGLPLIDVVHVSQAGMVTIGNTIGTFIANDYVYAPYDIDVKSDLVLACRMNDTASPAIDESGNGNNIPVTNGTFGAGGLTIDASNEIGTIDNTSEGVVDGASGTIIMHFTGTESIATTALGTLFGSRDPHTTGDFYVYRNPGGTGVFFALNDGVLRYIEVSVSNFPNWETTGHQITIQWHNSTDIYKSKKLAINIDGGYVDVATEQNATAINTFAVAASLGLLNNPISASPVNAVCRRLYIYKNRVLTIPEIMEVYNNPDSVISTKEDSFGISIDCGI